MSTTLIVIGLWIFGIAVVLPAVLLVWMRYERWVRDRRVGDVEIGPSVSRARRVPPAPRRSRR